MATISGGEKLEARLRELAQKVSNPGTLRVGFLEGSTYPDGTPVAMVAAIQDYGAPSRNIPPRPFFRNMVAEKKGEWPKAIEDLLIANDYDAKKALEITGEAIAGQLKDSILNGSYVPLKPATVKRKGFDKVLVDTGHMVNSVAYEVK